MASEFLKTSFLINTNQLLQTMQKTTIKIQGMTCAGCVSSAKKVLEAVSGVISADVSLDQAQAIIQYDATKSSIEQFKQAIRDAGFEVIS
jgi:copper chaperone